MPPLMLGGFGAASSRDITPMRQAIRASSPPVLAHAVSYWEACFPVHGRNAATFFTPYARPAFSPDTVGRTDGAISWGETLTKEAS
ncbi:hypothetical protein [Pectobacterium atrosepticum]|uniref:hypothetical protein n=1 Tax=Pectobacterium atrosepticum TaxID=29471 RepID=UPI00138E4555|nr:hypothetical protein [Pectobacterium atrosepticum]